MDTDDTTSVRPMIKDDPLEAGLGVMDFKAKVKIALLKQIHKI